MRAKFIGDPCFQRQGDGPDTIEAFGVTWDKGKARDVPKGMEDAVRQNSHFEEVVKKTGRAKNKR